MEKTRAKMLTHVKRRGGLFCSRVFAVTVKKKLSLTWFILAAVICALAVPLLVMNVVRKNEEVSERWTRGFERGWEAAVGRLTSVLAISVFELILVTGIIIGLFLLVRFFINLYTGRWRPILTGALSLGAVAVYILDLYMATMGFGYYRAPMPLPQAGEDYNAEQVVAAVGYFVDDFNALSASLTRDENGCVICPYTTRELAKLMRDEFTRLDEGNNGYFFSYTPLCKPIANSWFLSDVLITGITFLPTGECNVNIAAPSTVVTFTMAHEIAHTKGVQREGDATLISEYVLISSQNEYLRYCGYFETYYRILEAVELAGEDDAFYEFTYAIDPLIYKEVRFNNAYWRSQPDIMGKIGEFFNNLYLKHNGAENGVQSYEDGEETDIIPPPVDPDTGEVLPDPDTGEPQKPKPVYSTLQKMYFYIYEQRQTQKHKNTI